MKRSGFDDVPQLVAEYRKTAVMWDSLHAIAEMRKKGASKRANAVFRVNHSLYRRLRSSAIGRNAVEELMRDPAEGVRLLAATHVLPWNPGEAVGILQAIQESTDGRGHAFAAAETLRVFRSGKLDLDWE